MRISHVMGERFEFLFCDSQIKAEVDPTSVQGRILSHFYEGLPVLRWFNIVDQATGKALDVGGGIQNAEKTLKDGRKVTLLQHIADLDNATDGAKQDETSKEPDTTMVKLSGDVHAYRDVGTALRTLAEFIKTHGPFDGAFGFSQGANLLTTWLALCEAGIVDHTVAEPKWACCCCATQWGWAKEFDGRAEEFALAIGPELGARTPSELRQVAAATGVHTSSRLDCLMTGGRLQCPSLHLIGEEDPARPFSENMVELYAEETRTVLLHPNEHMPPKQKESALQLLEFAQHWSPTQDDRPVELV